MTETPTAPATAAELAADLAPYLLVATFPACDDIDGCGAKANQPCKPGCRNAPST